MEKPEEPRLSRARMLRIRRNQRRTRNRRIRRYTIASKQTVLWLTIPFLQDARDQSAVSLVSKKSYKIEAIERKHVYITNCYSITPSRVFERFTGLVSLKLKGCPFKCTSNHWGGYVRPWVEEVIRYLGPKMKSLHFKRMIVTDLDLHLLATSSTGNGLEILKLESCSGFSTDGLLHIVRFCRVMRILSIEWSIITENDGEWLRELSLNNEVLEEINFYNTSLRMYSSEDLEQIARRCSNLTSMKINSCDHSGLIRFFQAASSLEEFYGFSEPPPEPLEYVVAFPPRLCCLSLDFGVTEAPSVYLVASNLKQLEIIHEQLSTEGCCLLLQRCPSLEVLKVRADIGDRGVQVIAQFCKKIKRLELAQCFGGNDEGYVSQTGFITMAQGCLQLEFLAVEVLDITNASLRYIGRYLKKLTYFRLRLIDDECTSRFPIDEGVRSLLTGCCNLRSLVLGLRPGALTDLGLSYIGQCSPKVRRMELDNVGESDEGLLEFSRGCPSLQKLDIWNCRFSVHALSMAALQLTSLRCLKMRFHLDFISYQDLSPMTRPNWIVEEIRGDLPGDISIMAYYSLFGRRNDAPPSVHIRGPNVPLVLS